MATSQIITDFDELNLLVGYNKSIPYKKYFGEMEIPRWKRENLIEQSEEIEEVLNEAFVFVLLGIERSIDIDWNYVRLMIYNGILGVLSKETSVDTEYQYTLEQLAKNITDVTMQNLDKEYYLSQDRAMLIAENEANTYFNHQNHLNARLNGATKKEWLPVIDGATRQSHRDMFGTIVGIDDLFDVNGSQMRYPKDRLYGASASEIVNCRCTLRYIFN